MMKCKINAFKAIKQRTTSILTSQIIAGSSVVMYRMDVWYGWGYTADYIKGELYARMGSNS